MKSKRWRYVAASIRQWRCDFHQRCGGAEFAQKSMSAWSASTPIPVPASYHTFWRLEAVRFFGDTNQHGPEGVRFWTKVKTVTQRWPEDVQGAEFVIPTMK
ncbi:MAG: hypothetical protein R3C40_05085 [Parvularculaceae bacterium]